jgi:regulation of enolase protein 1 (concanavalin A-like superfamily)
MNLFDGCHEKSLSNGLVWLREPPEWHFDETGLTIIPEAKTDFFRGYMGTPTDNACLLYVNVTGDFTATTKAQAHLVGFGDAAAITVRASATQWAKLCLERSPIGDVSAVSVVTNPWSDDANNELLDKPECYLRLTRSGDVFAMHYSVDGARWRFVRTFGLVLPPTVMVGIHAQAPFGGGCSARFSAFTLTHAAVKDFRSGE